MSKQGRPRQRGRRLNPRALTVLVVLLIVLVPGFLAFKMVREQSGAAAVLNEARTQLKKGNALLAIGYLNRYLTLMPDDLDALEMKAKLLAETARDPVQVAEALSVHGQLIAAKPDDPRWDQARRRMVVLNLKVGRWRAALELAKTLRGGDAEAHRLYARASAAVGVEEKNAEAITKAREEYEAAEAKEPGDVESAEELAAIYRDRLEKPEKALQVLDQAVLNNAKVPRKHAAALLARGRFHAKALDIARATADVDEAVRDDPQGVMPRLIAAEIALQRRDTDTARHHLSAIAADHRDDLRVKTLEGLIDLAEARPEDAIRVWRAELLQVGGNDAALTWQLAHVLLETGRVSDAEPLLDQYRRLVGGDAPDPKYLYLSALALLRSNRPAEAAAVIESKNLRYKVPKSLEPHVLFALGQAYEATRDAPKAMDAYRQACEGSRQWAAPWKALARLQAETSTGEAQATLQKGLTLSPDDAELLAARAEYLYRDQLRNPPGQRDTAEVERLLARAAKAAPGSPDVAVIQAEYDANNQRGEDALARLAAASKLTPRSTLLWIGRANLLINLDRRSEALEVLDQAVEAAGPQAVFFVTRATVLIRQGHILEARKSLTAALDRVPKEQKAQIWKSLGDFYLGLKDNPSAAESYRQWAALQPDNPEPRVSLFRVAVQKGDDAEIARTIEEVRKVAGDRSYFWRLARVEDLLRVRKDEKPDPARDAGRLEDAQKLVKEIQINDPQLALGYVLDGQLSERLGKPKDAIAAYRKALERGAGQTALPPLVTLLAREKQYEEIEKLRKRFPALSTGIEQAAANQAVLSGDKSRAEQLARQAVEGDPQGLNTRTWEVEVLRALGKPREAEAAARKFIADRPTEPTPWLVLLMVQVNGMDLKAAAETVDQIRRNVRAERLELLLAQCYRAVGDMKRADESMRAAVARWPEDIGVLGAAVTFYEQSGRRDAAEETLRSILKRDPSNAQASRRLAMSLASHASDRSSWDEALSLVGPENRPNDVPDDQIIRAAVYAQGPEPAHLRKAIEILEAMLVELPSRSDIQQQVARLLLAINEPERARAHAAKAAEGEKASPDAILLYAGVVLGLKDITAAEEQLQRLLLIDPDGLPVVELKARLLAASGKAREGSDVLENAFSGRAGTAEGLAIGQKIVQILVELKQLDAAERVARRTAEIAPRGRCVLAELLAVRGRLDDAAEELEKVANGGDAGMAATSALALAAQPGADARWTSAAERYRAASSKGDESQPSFVSLERLSLLRHLERNYKEEVATYRRMLGMKPPSYLFLNNMAWTLSEGLNQPDEALKVVDKAIEKLGRQPNVLDTRGVILTRLGKYETAVRDLEAAARDLRDPTVDFHLARVYVKMGKADVAKKYRDRALKAGLVRERLQESERADWDTVMTP